jgi:hypothetical protein
VSEQDERGRPIIDRHLRQLVREIARAVPDLAQVDADRILFVAGAARLMARASIRPLGGANRPALVMHGVPMLYEICLRPRFFRETPHAQRLLTIVHEMWHASPRFDGTLAQERRHQNADPDWIEAEVARMVEQFARSGSSAGDFLRYKGEMRMLAWLVRPPSRIPPHSAMKRSYDEGDLFLAIVESRD